jgi:hypothetical protein
VNEARHKRPHYFLLYVMSRIGKSTQTKEISDHQGLRRQDNKNDVNGYQVSFFFFEALGFELSLTLARQVLLLLESLPALFFFFFFWGWICFEIGAHELFVWAGFKL